MNATKYNKSRGTSGFTLTEMLTVVAITVVLMGVAFVAVINYRRSMMQMELDATAKEIYFAAQNHLLTAQDQGLLGKSSEKGTLESDDVYYFVYAGPDSTGVNSPEGNNADSPEGNGANSALGLMLPFGSIDDTIRIGGSYIIEYQASTGLIMNVFYASPNGLGGLFGTFGAHTFSSGEANRVLALTGEENASARRDYDGAVLGYYGGEDAGAARGADLKPLILTIENGDKLIAKVTDPNGLDDGIRRATKLTLIIEGESSKAHASVVLRVTNGGVTSYDKSTDKGKVSGYYYEYVLDDVTAAENHIEKQPWVLTSSPFIPGEDIKVTAVLRYTDLVGKTVEASDTDNSLFASVQTDATSESSRAAITSFRHLENLDKSISGVDTSSLALVGADLETDLSWTKFLTDNGETLSVYSLDGNASKAATMLPVNPDVQLDFAGKSHTISDVAVETAVESEASAGLFGTLKNGSAVQNLELVDFSVTSTNNTAGMLVGTAGTDVTIKDVHAYDSTGDKKNVAKGATSAGGLIGAMDGGEVTACSASVLVESSGSDGVAGGLIGTAQNVSVTASYAAGHTTDGLYSTEDGNVASQGTSGGFIGLANAVTVDCCYTTCSAFGATDVGGFVGSARGGSIANSYATGLIGEGASNAGMFCGTATGVEFTKDQYLETISYGRELLPVATGDASEEITAADADTQSYQAFAPASWSGAQPYDNYLATHYNGKYPFKTTHDLAVVAGIAGEDTELNAIAPSTHYGDWPAPETFVVNTPA